MNDTSLKQLAGCRIRRAKHNNCANNYVRHRVDNNDCDVDRHYDEQSCTRLGLKIELDMTCHMRTYFSKPILMPTGASIIHQTFADAIKRYTMISVGPILDDRLKEKLLKP